MMPQLSFVGSDNRIVDVYQTGKRIGHIDVPTDGYVKASDVHLHREYPDQLKEHVIHAFYGALARNFIKKRRVA